MRLRAGVPRRPAAVEIARAMRPVGLGRELVDGGGVEGVPALPCALDVPVLAAPRAEEVALEPLAIRASAAAAFRRKCGPSSATTRGPAVETRLARARPLPVGLDCAWPAATRLNAARRLPAHDGVRDEARRNLTAPVGDEGFEVHVVLLFRLATRCASVPERAARARRPVTSRQRGRSVRRTRRVDRPSTRDTLARTTDDRTCRWSGRCGTAVRPAALALAAAAVVGTGGRSVPERHARLTARRCAPHSRCHASAAETRMPGWPLNTTAPRMGPG